MTSTDIDGSPILILGEAEVRVARTAIAMVTSLHDLGDLRIHEPDKWEKLRQKMNDFLDEHKDGV